MLSLVRLMALRPSAAAFSEPRFIWEIKHDGFRGPAYVEGGHCRLVLAGRADLLWLNEYDLRAVPLLERTARLLDLLPWRAEPRRTRERAD